jgi:hypothetical protein
MHGFPLGALMKIHTACVLALAPFYMTIHAAIVALVLSVSDVDDVYLAGGFE